MVRTCCEGGEEIVAAQCPGDADCEQRERQVLRDVGLAVDVSLAVGELHQVRECDTYERCVSSVSRSWEVCTRTEYRADDSAQNDLVYSSSKHEHSKVRDWTEAYIASRRGTNFRLQPDGRIPW